MTREIKTFKNKTDGYDGDKKLAMKRKNQPAKNFKHFEDVDHKDPWEIARENGENWRAMFDEYYDAYYDSLYD